MAQTIIIHYGKNRPRRAQPAAHPQQAQPQNKTQVTAQSSAQAPAKTRPIAIQQPQQQTSAAAATPARDQYRTIVRPRFIGDSFVYVPVKVPTVNPDGSPIKSPSEMIMEWLFGKKD